MPPKDCKGYGLEVLTLYDDGKDNWLSHRSGNYEEWPLFYHGTSNTLNCINGII